MTTNEERSEVASRLRVLASHVPADAELVLDALDLYEGECIDGFEPRCVERLADLIEPEECTCRVDRRVPSNPFCSKCGKDWDDDWYYCPRCGAKVASDV